VNSKEKFSAILLAVYTVMYFGIALMVSATFKDIAATQVAGIVLVNSHRTLFLKNFRMLLVTYHH